MKINKFIFKKRKEKKSLWGWGRQTIHAPEQEPEHKEESLCLWVLVPGGYPVPCRSSSCIWPQVRVTGDFPGGSDGKASAYNAGDLGSIPGSGRSPGEGSGNPLQFSCQENPMDGGAWWATVHGVAKSWTRLSDFTVNVSCIAGGFFTADPPGKPRNTNGS